MAANLISVTVVGFNATEIASKVRLLPTPYMVVNNENIPTRFSDLGAQSVIEIPNGPAGGGTSKYYVTETKAAILAAANADTVTDLSVVGTLTTTGYTTLGASLIVKRTAVAINATATMADGDMKKGYITSTSAAATAITTRTATQLATELGAAAGSTYKFVVDNVSGANTVTITPGSGLTAASAVTGGTDMTLAAGEIGVFEIVFKSGTAAQISRIS